MKNLLSENLLRFGVKNLTESQKKELIVKSIMETIDQHGLHYDIQHRLMEQDPNTTTLPNVTVRPKMQDAGQPLPGFAKGQQIRLGKLVNNYGEGMFLIQKPGDANRYEPTWMVQTAVIKKTYDQNSKPALGATLVLKNVYGTLNIQIGANQRDYYVTFTPGAAAKGVTFPAKTLGSKQELPVEIEAGLKMAGIVGDHVSISVFSKTPINQILQALQASPLK
jgi:hypothetical protein